MKETLYRNVDVKASLKIAARSSAATVNGDAVDRNDDLQGYRSVMVLVHTGTITDGTHTIQVQASDASDSGFTAVADAELLGTEPAVGEDDDDAIYMIGYLGSKRYVRVCVTTAGATTGGVLGAVVLLGGGRRPVSRS